MNGGILFASPSRYEGDDAFYVKRDAFRFVEYFQRIGISTRMVLLSAKMGGETPGDERLVVAPYERWIDPDFWKAFNVRTVIVYSFGVLRPPPDAARLPGNPRRGLPGRLPDGYVVRSRSFSGSVLDDEQASILVD